MIDSFFSLINQETRSAEKKKKKKKKKKKGKGETHEI